MAALLFNEQKLRDQFLGDEDILLDLIEQYLAHNDRLLMSIEESINKEIPTDLKLHAHTYKGVVSNFYSLELIAITYDLETLAGSGNFIEAKKRYESLKSVVEDFKKELTALKRSMA